MGESVGRDIEADTRQLLRLEQLVLSREIPISDKHLETNCADSLPRELRARTMNALGVAAALAQDTERAAHFFAQAIRCNLEYDLAWDNSQFLNARFGGARSLISLPPCGAELTLNGLRLVQRNASSDHRIPNIVHVCFGFAADFGGKPFSLIHYLAIKSAVLVNRPDVVNFYYHHAPTGPWWEQAKQYVDIVRIVPPTQVFGNCLYHPAHMADVVRLDRLISDGGIYLDLDVICLRPFTPLLSHDFVIAAESDEGLCNAVLLCAKGAPFARRWHDAYKTFRSKGRDEYWGEHSVKVPQRLAVEHPGEVHVLDSSSFFSPTWDDHQLAIFFRGECEQLFCENSFCVHLWEQLSWERYLRDLTVGDIVAGKSEFCRLVAPFIDKVTVPPARCRTPVRFDLGGVGEHPNGRTSVNLSGPADIIHDITDLDGYIEDNECVDEFFLHHTLEHIPTHAYRVFLADLFRKLRPGGKVIIVQTDAASVIKQYVRGALSFRAMRATIFPPADRLRLNPLNQHFSMSTAESLIDDLLSVGFEATEFDAGAWPFDLEDEFVPDECARHTGTLIRNLGVTGTKPFVMQTKPKGVIGVSS